MSSVAYFTARRVIANAGSRVRLMQTRTNGFTHQTSQFRTWTTTKNVFGQKKGNTKVIVGGAAIGVVMAGVAMYPTDYPSGRHSLYPGIPIPVTSLNRGGEEKDDTSEVKLVVVEKLDKPKKDVEEDPIPQELEITSPSKTPEEIPPETVEETKTIPSDDTKSEPESNVIIETVDAVKTTENVEDKGIEITKKTFAEVKEIPDKVPYLLIGAGTASFAAYRAIKAKEPTAKILIIGDENRLPYMRPPLSKELWYPPLEEVEIEGKKITRQASTVAIDDAELKFRQWNGRERSLYYEPEPFYTPLSKLENRENGGISVLRGKRVEKVDPKNQIAYLDDGTEIGYDKCLIATG